jgi:hypothetical protein
MRGQHLEGALITAALALVIANLVPLEAIATMGSAGPPRTAAGEPAPQLLQSAFIFW